MRFHSCRATPVRWLGQEGMRTSGFGSFLFTARLPGLPSSSFSADGLGLRPCIMMILFLQKRHVHPPIPPLPNFAGARAKLPRPVYSPKPQRFRPPYPCCCDGCHRVPFYNCYSPCIVIGSC